LVGGSKPDPSNDLLPTIPGNPGGGTEMVEAGGGRGGLGGNMLAVRYIPAAFNTITHLNGHFSRYGALQNVQVQFEGDPSSALITFHSTEEANMAFNSSEAVMNNRFIKMFWHSDRGNVKNRLGGGGFGPGKFSKTISNDSTHEEMDPEKVKELKDKEMIAVKKNQEMLQAKNELLKKASEKRKAAMAQPGGILKSKRDLLDGLIEQQKALIVKIEKGKGTMKQEEKTKVMSLLKELSNSIDKTKEDIKNMISISGLKKRSKAEVISM
jgi:RNA-binding protein 26